MSGLSMVHAIKAREFLRSLGGKVAGGYLRNRGYSFDEALTILGFKARGL